MIITVPRALGGTLFIVVGPSVASIPVVAYGRDGIASAVGRDGKLTVVGRDGAIRAISRDGKITAYGDDGEINGRRA